MLYLLQFMMHTNSNLTTVSMELNFHVLSCKFVPNNHFIFVPNNQFVA